MTNDAQVPDSTPAQSLVAKAHPALVFIGRTAIVAGVCIVLGAIVWQAHYFNGAPDPTIKGISPTAAIINTGILVFREGLETILVLSALTASLFRTNKNYWKPVAIGAALSFLATVATWFVVVALLGMIDSGDNATSLNVQAGTGLVAIVVLLVIMNWFFHKIYWAGWIIHHDRRRRELMEAPGRTAQSIFMGLVLLGFTSVYREGFEVVLFLQSFRLKMGTPVVLKGVVIGLGLTIIVGALTFVAHHKLPYRKMLIATGIMLGFVLLVMVGEEVQEMQLAHWISTTDIMVQGSKITFIPHADDPAPGTLTLPDWLGLWFSIFPNVETIAAQVGAAVLVIGSYFLATRHRGPEKHAEDEGGGDHSA